MSFRHSLSTVLIRQFRQTIVPRTRKLSSIEMEPKVNLKEDPAYKKLQEFYNANSEKINIQQLFQQDPDRFNKFR